MSYLFFNINISFKHIPPFGKKAQATESFFFFTSRLYMYLENERLEKIY